MTRRRADAGVVSVELLAVTPLLAVMAVFALQVGLVLWGVASADTAVRHAVRATSLGQDGCAAARGVLPAALDLRTCETTGGSLGAGNAARLAVAVPVLGPASDWVPPVTIHREAYLP